MFKSFVNKFFFIYALSSLLLVGLLTISLTNVIEDFFIVKQQQFMIDEGKTISDQYVASYYKGDMNRINFDYQIQIVSSHLNSRIWILSPDGTIHIDSVKGALSMKGSKINNASIEKAATGEIVVGKSDFHHLFPSPVITVIVPIELNNAIKGLIVMNSPYPGVKESIDYVFNLTFTCLLITLIFTYVLTYLFSRSIAKPFTEMNKTAKAVANGNFNSRVEVKSKDEIGQLASNLNYMVEELEKLEDSRKSFIANISHDFRSPLTSIKGFVQAILDKTIPYERQDRYLQIVLDETDRLTKLTNDLLLLSKLENSNIKLNFKSFDIHHIIRKVLIQFEQKIVEKEIDITLLMNKKELIVNADIDKIQRVLYNLIDNAVKFCNVGDSIVVETTELKNKAKVSIKDTGPGITEKELHHIWERFHKTDSSRGLDKTGVGLGLSIVREIIKAHNETIDIYSEEGIGTEFIFTLKLQS